MSIPTPTTKEVADNIVAQLQAELGQTIPFLPKSFTSIMSKAFAAVIMILYKYAGWIFLQMFVSRAENQYFEINGVLVNPLIEWGNLIGAGPPQAATQAVLMLNVLVINQVGSLPSGTQLIGASNGVTYLTTEPVLLNTSVVQVPARAVSDQSGGGGAGTIGNLPVNSIVSFANSQINVQQNTFVAGAVVTGANAESTAAYRARVTSLFQRRPQGGAYVDYGIWGMEPEGIAAIYPYTGYPGQVDVYVESATEVDGIPTPAQLAAVEDSIEFDQDGLATRRPANAFVNVLPIYRSSFDVEVLGISNVTNLSQIQTAVTAAIQAYFLEREPYIPGYSIGVNRSNILKTAISAIVSGIVSAEGGLFSGVILKFNLISIDAYALNEGEKAKLGLIEFN